MRRLVALLAGLTLCAAPALAQPDTVRWVSGRVVDAGSRVPLRLVQVSPGDPTRQDAVKTDTLGRFRLPVPAHAASRLRFLRLGYLPAEREVRVGADDLLVEMEAVSEALDARIITASRREERLADAVVASEVIGRREIARSGASDIAALLERQVGAQPEGGTPAGVGVTLQGLGAQRVLILLDGQPIAGRIGGNLDLTRLPLSLVERVEIVKGPQSTLYGSDAMGGVVNLVTRGSRPDDAPFGIEATIGSLDRREGSGHIAIGRGSWDARIDGGASLVALAPGVASDAGTRARRLHVAPRVSWAGPNADWRVATSALAVDESQRYRSGQLFNFSDNTQFNARLSAQYRRGTGRAEPTMSWSRYEHLSRRAATPLPASDSGARDRQQLVQFEVPVSVALGSGVVDAGLLLRRESIRADRVPGGARVLHAGEPYVQGTFGSGPLLLTAGSRLSLHERWGTFVAPRLALLWRPREAIAVRLGTGMGYRAPDFKELYLSFANTAAGYAVEGNPDLVPERSASASLNLTFTGHRLTARVGAHRTGYRDFIETGAADASGTYTYANIARGSTAGVEWEGTAAMGPLRLTSTYAWLTTRDDATGGPLLGRAERTGSLGAGREILDTDVDVRLLWVGRAPIGRDETTGTYEYRRELRRVDLTASRPFSWGVTVRGGVTNLLDAEADGSWPGFTGRRLYVGLGAEFGARAP